MTTTNARLVCSIADTPESREEVYKLRYCCYQGKGSIDPRPDQRFADHFDEAPNNFSFLVRNAAQKAMATVRISVVKHDLNWIEAPACHVFGDHPNFAKVARESFVEASRLCFGQSARRDVFLKLLGNMAAMAEHYEVGWLLACPRMEHAGLYQRLFGFRPMAEPRPYFGVKFQTQMLGIRVEELRDHVHRARLMQNAWDEALAQLTRTLPISMGMARGAAR